MRVLAWMVALAALLAGCTDANDADDPDEPGMAAPGGTPGDSTGSVPATLIGDGPSLAFTDCLQFHTSYLGRAEDFQDRVPEGYELVQDDQGLVDLYVTPSACNINGTTSSQMWISLAVAPPADKADPEAFHRIALEAYADQAVADELSTWGIDLVVPCACQLDQTVPQALGFTVQSEMGDYEMQTALTPSTGPFDVPPTWMYVAKDGHVTHRLYFGPGASQNLGLGTVILAYQGPGGAPPVFPGYAAHVIDALSFNLTVEGVA